MKEDKDLGSIIKIELINGTFCFARKLKNPLYAFYDINTKDTIPPLEEIIASNILFKIWVMDRVISSNRWIKIGKLDLEDELYKPVTFCHQNALNKKVYLYINGEKSITTKEECNKFERTAVWEPEHVEDRLRDYFSGENNKWVESLRIK